jgi:cytochrome P450
MVQSSMLGNSLVSSRGEDWKRHRRITGPAFNPTTYRNVWNTSVRVYKEMVEAEDWLQAATDEPRLNESHSNVAVLGLARKVQLKA